MTDVGSTSPISCSEPLTGWPGKRYLGLTAVVWTRIFIVVALMSALFWPNLRRLWLKTNLYSGENNWLHSPFVPALGLYYLYLNRDALLNARRQNDWSLRGKALASWAQFQVMLLGVLFFVRVYTWPLLAARARYVVAGIPFLLGAVALWLALWSTATRSFRARRQLPRHSQTPKQAGAGEPMPEPAGPQAPGRPVLDYRRPDSDGQVASSAILRDSLRDTFSSLADRSSQWFGLYTLLWGLVFYAWGIWPGQNDFFKDAAMVVVLFGVTLILAGWRVMKTAWFPILFLVCAIPWPGLMYAKIALPLQELAAYVACVVLKITGVDAVKEGTKILINAAGSMPRALNVAEACAGLKSLMTFITVAAAVGFLSHRRLWERLLIVASAGPIAILCNVFRVAGQGLLDTYATPKLSDGFAHQFVGMVMIIPAFFMILFVGWLLDNLFVEEVDRRSMLGGQKTPLPAKQNLVIEIPRARARAAGQTPGAGASVGPVAPTSLADATQRLMNARVARRGNSTNVAPAPVVRAAATAERKDEP
ncbi:MAG: exosortase/archaeosortase family protein [Tepidisphaerales bacterium]